MIRHGCAGRFYNAFRIDSVMRSDGLLQRRVPIAVVAIDFELLQIDRQFAKWKWRHAARCEIEPRATLRLRPMHVVRVLVSHATVRKSCRGLRKFSYSCSSSSSSSKLKNT